MTARADGRYSPALSGEAAPELDRTEAELSRQTRARRRYHRERRRESGRWRYRPLLRALAIAAAGLGAAAVLIAGAALVTLTGSAEEPDSSGVVASMPLAAAEGRVPPPDVVALSVPTPDAPVEDRASDAVAPSMLTLDAVAQPLPGPGREVAMLHPPPAPPWRQPDDGKDGTPKVALIIDDVGLSSFRTDRVIALPAPVTLAFLPYGPQAPDLAARATAAGHELLLHLPMEPEDDGLDPGPNALELGLSPEELDRRIAWNLGRLSGYVGVNNHMGSRFTRSAPEMRRLMAALKHRNLLFVDSVTTNHTVGTIIAREHGVATIGRDVFLDTVQDPTIIAEQLREVEETARRHGHAVAIGHPYPVTLDALERWLPTLPAKGLRLVPVSAVARAAPEG